MQYEVPKARVNLLLTTCDRYDWLCAVQTYLLTKCDDALLRTHIMCRAMKYTPENCSIDSLPYLATSFCDWQAGVIPKPDWIVEPPKS